LRAKEVDPHTFDAFISNWSRSSILYGKSLIVIPADVVYPTRTPYCNISKLSCSPVKLLSHCKVTELEEFGVMVAILILGLATTTAAFTSLVSSPHLSIFAFAIMLMGSPV
jgi:hypothetical protein